MIFGLNLMDDYYKGVRTTCTWTYDLSDHLMVVLVRIVIVLASLIYWGIRQL